MIHSNHFPADTPAIVHSLEGESGLKPQKRKGQAPDLPLLLIVLQTVIHQWRGEFQQSMDNKIMTLLTWLSNL